MVVLSASILAHNGSKPLLSRQFVEMPRMRIEGLLAAFPKLLSSPASARPNSTMSSMNGFSHMPSHNKQHTFVETDTVRYIYQPLENNIYVLLITTKTSNIVEDLGTLRLLAKVIPDVSGSFSESVIQTKAFELIFAFDEVINVGGYREDITLSNIQKNLQMESHEEKMFLMLQEKKKEEAKKAMEEKANEIKKRQMENMKNNFMDGNFGNSSGGGGRMQGFGGGGYQSNSPFDDMFNPNPNNNTGFQSSYSSQQPKPVVDEGPRVVAKGMKLGGLGTANKKDNLLSSLAAEDHLGSLLSSKSKTAAGGKASNAFAGLSSAPAPAATVAAPSTPLTILLEEKFSITMNREGGFESCDLKGTLTLTANTDAGSDAQLSINKSVLNSKCSASNWNFATHPKVSKPDYESSGLIILKGGKGLPLGRPVGVLKWSYNGEDAVPLTINCWPEDEGTGSIIVNIEFNLLRNDMTLHDVNILLPVGTTESPSIESIDGQYKFDSKNGMLCWHQDVIDKSNSSGSLEFSVPGTDVDAFFPVQVLFKSQNFMCPIEVQNVTNGSNGNSIPNSLIKSVIPETYQVV